MNDTPGLAVVIDSSEQRTQRPKRRQRAYYSGKKKAHTLKSQVAVDERSGRIVDVSDSVPGRWADIKWLKRSRLMERLSDGVGGSGDLGYTGIRDVHPSGACPRRKRRGTDRPPEDVKYNRAFSRRRIVVEHGIGRWRTSTGTGGTGTRCGLGPSPGWSTECSTTERTPELGPG